MSWSTFGIRTYWWYWLYATCCHLELKLASITSLKCTSVTKSDKNSVFSIIKIITTLLSLYFFTKIPSDQVNDSNVGILLCKVSFSELVPGLAVGNVFWVLASVMKIDLKQMSVNNEAEANLWLEQTLHEILTRASCQQILIPSLTEIIC